MGERSKVGTLLLGLALVSGCGMAPNETSGSPELENIKYRCPDPSTDCTMSNGTGVYTGEDGKAYIDDDFQIMITYFQNVTYPSGSTGVSFQGRYYNAQSSWWLPLPKAGLVSGAEYGTQTNLVVRSIHEVGTLPTVTLGQFNSDGSETTYTVTGSDLVSLHLHLSLSTPTTGKELDYVLDFNKATDEPGNQVVHEYNMVWRKAGQPATANQQYCWDGNGKPDPVVFQHGIYVNPTSATVTRNQATADLVTLSCRQGGPATVWWWGYPYTLGANTWYFDAGLQMKRASYCADSQHYTHTGTKIAIHDDVQPKPVQSDSITRMEAFWTPQGATCLDEMRHPDMGFKGECNGVKLPQCPKLSDQPDGGAWLADGVVAQ